MGTLADALVYGEGIERPFRCEAHEDHSASASVNVLKGVWCCYACGASGAVDKKKAPSVDALEVMLRPEQNCRVYPDAYLELFANEMGNFAKRFPPWLRHHAQLGCDPLTADATFPVRTPDGLLAGVGRRKEHPGENEGRYAYPPRWSASRSLFVVGAPGDVLVLVEGAADASAVAQTGVYAAALFGSGLHKPQIDLIMRLGPKLVVLALDADTAGYKGMHGGMTKEGKEIIGADEILSKIVETTTLDWAQIGAKDPAEADVMSRGELLRETVRASKYSPDIDLVWGRRVKALMTSYERSVEASR